MTFGLVRRPGAHAACERRCQPGSRHRKGRDKAGAADPGRARMVVAALPARERAIGMVAETVRQRRHARPQSRDRRARPKIGHRVLAISGKRCRTGRRDGKGLRNRALVACAARRKATGKVDGFSKPSSSLVATAAFGLPDYVNIDRGEGMRCPRRIQVDAPGRMVTAERTSCNAELAHTRNRKRLHVAVEPSKEANIPLPA